MKLFRPDGTMFEFDEDLFVEYYRNDYFLNKEDYKVSDLRNRSNDNIEEEIIKILKKGKGNRSYDKRDIARILAWKIGFIDHKKSNTDFVYQKYWTDLEQRADKINGVVKRGVRSNNEDFPIGRIAEYIVKNQDDLKRVANNSPRDFLNLFKIEERNKERFKGLGTVYILTLLYFLSGEKYPIYDKFAHKAAKAIVLDVNPREVYVGPAPDKAEVDSIITMYSEYCWLLTKIFGTRDDNCFITRKQDQALWVYGHSKEKFPVSDDKSKDKKLFDFDIVNG